MKKARSLLLAAAPIAAAALLAGCETESSGDVVITVTPSYQSLGANGTVALTAGGGWDYRWKLDNPAAGHLDRTTGQRVVYTAVQAGPTQIVTVTAMGGGTNATPLSASATIQQ